jgi:integrase
MPSIFKRPRSPYFFCSFRNGDGRWLKKSTKQTDRKKALATCVAWDTAATSASNRTLTAAQARKVLSQMVEYSSGETLTSYTTKSWFTEFLDNKSGATSKATLARYSQVARDFLEHLGTRADTSLAGVTPNDIRSFRDKLRSEGRAVSTCNIVVKKILSLPFEKARTLGYIPINPTKSIDALKDKAEAREAEREPFTPEEVSSLIELAPEEWQGVIIVAATTGLRLGDIASMTWEQIDLTKRTLSVDPQKTDPNLTIPLHSDFLKWLSKQTRGIGNAPVFPYLSTRKIGGDKGLSMNFRRLMTKAGILEKTSSQKGEAGRTRHSKGFHSLRHTFISNLANLGVPAEVREKIAGHSDARTHQQYTHHEIETLRQAVEKLPSLRKTKVNT